LQKLLAISALPIVPIVILLDSAKWKLGIGWGHMPLLWATMGTLFLVTILWPWV
jgi:hypothetical protein